MDKPQIPSRILPRRSADRAQKIRVITAPFFLGTKMEAFTGRDRMDFQASHDLEDFVAVIEGRETLLKEIAESPLDLQDYLAEAGQITACGTQVSRCFIGICPGQRSSPHDPGAACVDSRPRSGHPSRKPKCSRFRRNLVENRFESILDEW